MTIHKPAALRAKTVLRWVLSTILIFTGVSHLANPGSFERIMPPMVPWPHFFVIVTGFCELAAALGLQGDFLRVKGLRRVTAWMLVIFLIAVFPANIYMALHPEITETMIGGKTVLGMSAEAVGWLRLPLQIPLILWAWWYT